MSFFRQIHTHIWKDPFFFRLDPVQKLHFIYLFSNERVSISGIYEISIEIISFETRIKLEWVKDHLNSFSESKKVFYDYEKEIIWVRNLRKYNAPNPSATQLSRINKDIAAIPECEIKQVYLAFHNPSIPYPDENIPYRYGIDTLSIEENRIGDSIVKAEGVETPSNLQGWLDKIRTSKNTPADLLFMLNELYPAATEVPSFSYIGRVSNNVGGAGRLAQLLWEGASNNPTGDILRYVQGIHRKQNKNNKPNKRKEQPPAEAVLEELENGK